MITGELKSKVDRIWDTMWSGGISNPLSVIEQLTYLLFIKRLDELQTLRERKTARTGGAVEEPIFREDQAALRWSRSKEMAREQMFHTVCDQGLPFAARRVIHTQLAGSGRADAPVMPARRVCSQDRGRETRRSWIETRRLTLAPDTRGATCFGEPRPLRQ